MTHRTAPPDRAPVVGPAPPPSPSGASGDHFAAILDSHQARTATAEGRSSDPKTSRQDEREPRTDAQDRLTADRSQLTDADTAAGTDATRQSAAPDKGADDGAQKAAGKDAAAKGAETSAVSYSRNRRRCEGPR